MWSIGGGGGGVIHDTLAPIYFCACILDNVLVNYVWPLSEIYPFFPILANLKIKLKMSANITPNSNTSVKPS